MGRRRSRPRVDESRARRLLAIAGGVAGSASPARRADRSRGSTASPWCGIDRRPTAARTLGPKPTLRHRAAAGGASRLELSRGGTASTIGSRPRAARELAAASSESAIETGGRARTLILERGGSRRARLRGLGTASITTPPVSCAPWTRAVCHAIRHIDDRPSTPPPRPSNAFLPRVARRRTITISRRGARGRATALPPGALEAVAERARPRRDLGECGERGEAGSWRHARAASLASEAQRRTRCLGPARGSQPALATGGSGLRPRRGEASIARRGPLLSRSGGALRYARAHWRAPQPHFQTLA